MVDKFLSLGISLIIAGIILIIITPFLISGNVQTSGAFVITLFFIPIAGSFGQYGDLLLILLIILTIIIILVNLILWILSRKPQPSTSFIPPS